MSSRGLVLTLRAGSVIYAGRQRPTVASEGSSQLEKVAVQSGDEMTPCQAHKHPPVRGGTGGHGKTVLGEWSGAMSRPQNSFRSTVSRQCDVSGKTDKPSRRERAGDG